MQYANHFLNFLLKQEHRTAKAMWTRHILRITSSLNKKKEKKEDEHVAENTEIFTNRVIYVGVLYWNYKASYILNLSTWEEFSSGGRKTIS